jgi:hypothetical protein
MKNLIFLANVLCMAASLTAQSPGKPDWTIRKPRDTAEMSYFTSVVDEFTREDEALRSAVNNVNNAVANSTIVYIRSSVSERSRNTEKEAAFTIDIETDSYTDIILSGIKIVAATIAGVRGVIPWARPRGLTASSATGAGSMTPLSCGPPIGTTILRRTGAAPWVSGLFAPSLYRLRQTGCSRARPRRMAGLPNPGTFGPLEGVRKRA